MTLEQLYKKEYGPAVKRAKGWTGCIEDAEDIVQDAFERCVRYERTIGSVEHAFPMILKNCYRDWQSVSKRQGMSMTESLDHTEEDFPDLSFDADIEHVKELVSTKTGKYGEILDLLIVKGYTQEEVGIMLSVSRQAIGKHINKFKEELSKEK